MAFTYGTITYGKNDSGNIIYYNTTPVYQVRLGYQVNSQDIELNKSNITLQLEVRSVNSQYITYGYNQTTTIDGTTLGSKTFDFRSTNVWQIFGTRTFDVSHNADGTYSVEKSGSFTTNVSGTNRPKSGSATVQVTLPTIPRASTITVNDANIGSSTNIVINKASASFTTTLSYKASGQNNWTTIVTKTPNQVYGWTVPTSFYSLIPNSKTISCEFKAETFSGDTLVGEKTTTATFTATGNPIINSSSAIDINPITANLTEGTSTSSKVVKYASNVQVSVNASGQNGASISSITVNGTALTLSGTNPKTGSITINGASTNVFTIVATDTRGYQTTTTKTMTIVNYVPLSINATIKRNQPTDNKININASGNYFDDSFGSQSNTLTVEYRYKESTDSWTGHNWLSDMTVSKSGNTYTAYKQLSNMDYTKQYDFEIKATDKVGTKSITGIRVSKGTPVYWWDDDQFNINGKLYTSNAGREDYAAFGFTYDGAGNMRHKRSDGGDNFGIDKYDGTRMLSFWPESGNAVINGSATLTGLTVNGNAGTNNIVKGGTIEGQANFETDTYTKQSFMGSTNVGGTWYNLINVRHRNGSGDGTSYGLQMRSVLTSAGSELEYRNNYGGSWSGWTKVGYTTGSNTNGYWIKYADGTMECYKTVTGTVNITTSWGNGYTTGNANTVDLGNFPQTFTAEPNIQVTVRRGTGGYNFWLGTVSDSTASYAGKISLLRFTSASSVGYILWVRAIGKWK
jgi:hypothetical protein